MRLFIVALLGKLLLSRVNVVVVMVDFLGRMHMLMIVVSGIYVRVIWLLILEVHLLVAVLNRRLDWRDMIFCVVIDGIFVIVTPI